MHSKKKVFWFRLVALLLAVSLMVIVFHHHSHHDDESDCPVCNFVRHVVAVFGLVLLVIFGIFLQSFLTPICEKYSSLLRIKDHLSRAPPALA